MTRTPMAPVTGLSRLSSLPPPSRRPQHAPSPSPDPAPAPREETAPVKPRQSRPQPTTHHRVSETAVTRRAITLSLPAVLIQDLRARARRDGTTQPDVLMDALVACRDRLPALLEKDGVRTQAQSDGLFLRQTTTSASATEALGTVTLRLLGPNIDAIDALARESGAASRSALCACALREYLG